MPTPTSPDDIHSKSNLAALAVVVIFNWQLAHVATNWVMPQEVQSSLQTLLAMSLVAWLQRRVRQANGATTPPTPVVQ